jgi:hypothetical protein
LLRRLLPVRKARFLKSTHNGLVSFVVWCKTISLAITDGVQPETPGSHQNSRGGSIPDVISGSRDDNNAPISPQPFLDVSTMTDPEQGGNRRAAIAGLAIAVVLLAVGLWLAHELTGSSKMQDCLMSGRTNCNVIDAPTR